MALRRVAGRGSGPSLVLLAGLWAWADAAQAQPTAAADPAYQGFFVPLQPQGEIKVELHVDPRATNQVMVMSFGVPFPPGCLRGVGQVYLKDSGGQGDATAR